MAVIELCNVVNKEIEYSEEISAPDNSGQIIIDIDEDNFNEKMSRGLAGILFTMYVKLEGKPEYIPIENRSYIWNSKKDLSMVITDIPTSFYFGIQPIIDCYYDMKEYISVEDETFDASIKYYTRTGNGTTPSPYVYLLNTSVTQDNFDKLKKNLYRVDTSIDYTSFPISVYFDNAGQSSGGGSKPKALEVTLVSTDWDNNSQSVTVEGVTDTNLVQVSPSTDSYTDYANANIRATAQAENELTFECDTTPSVDITVNVVIWG